MPAVPHIDEIAFNQGQFDFRRGPVASSVYVPVLRPAAPHPAPALTHTTLTTGDLR